MNLICEEKTNAQKTRNATVKQATVLSSRSISSHVHIRLLHPL
jgi:hypothetical protein